SRAARRPPSTTPSCTGRRRSAPRRRGCWRRSATASSWSTATASSASGTRPRRRSPGSRCRPSSGVPPSRRSPVGRSSRHGFRTRLLDVIADESNRLAEIVNDLLLASHLDSGELQVSIEQCDPRELAESVLETASTHLPEAITLSLKAPEQVPWVAADRGQLRQVLVNLVENAIKYSPDGGPVEIELEQVGQMLRFAVHDVGLGVPESERTRIFEKFYRLDP